MRLATLGWSNNTVGCVVYLRSLTFSMADSVIKGIGVQQTLDYGKTYTVGAANTVPGKYNSETIQQVTFEGHSAWKYSYVSGGTSYGSFYLPVSFKVQDYAYVTYDIYVVDSVLTGCVPRINADAGADTAKGYIDDNTSGYAVKVGEWQTVTLKLDANKTGNVTRIQMFPLGDYMNAVHSGCSEYYMSDITFHEKMPVENREMQSVAVTKANKDVYNDWHHGVSTKNVAFPYSYNNGLGVKAFKISKHETDTWHGMLVLDTMTVDFSTYRYISYSFYIDDVNGDYKSDVAFAPCMESYGASEMSKTWEAGKWHTVVIPVSETYTEAKTGYFSIWTLGSYAKKDKIGTPDVYVSSISFLSEDPNADVEKPTQNIRFISVLKDSDLKNYSAVGYKVIANGIEQIVESTVVYTSVVGAAQTYTPDSVGGSYFSVVRIDDVPIGDEIKFTVIAYVKTVDGNIIESLPVEYTMLGNGLFK